MFPCLSGLADNNLIGVSPNNVRLSCSDITYDNGDQVYLVNTSWVITLPPVVGQGLFKMTLFRQEFRGTNFQTNLEIFSLEFPEVRQCEDVTVREQLMILPPFMAGVNYRIDISTGESVVLQRKQTDSNLKKRYYVSLRGM